MKNLFYVSTLFALSACGISEEDFGTEYGQAYCDQLVTCESDFTCEGATETTSTATGTDMYEGCEFDAAQAQACLDGEWSCDDLKLPVPPTECNSVYSCPATGTATGT